MSTVQEWKTPYSQDCRTYAKALSLFNLWKMQNIPTERIRITSRDLENGQFILRYKILKTQEKRRKETEKNDT